MCPVHLFLFYLPARTATTVRCPIFNTTKSYKGGETDKEREREKTIVWQNKRKRGNMKCRFFPSFPLCFTHTHALKAQSTPFSLSSQIVSLLCERSMSRQQGCILGVWRVNSGSFFVLGQNPAGFQTEFPLKLLKLALEKTLWCTYSI